jgi:antitoxin HicB
MMEKAYKIPLCLSPQPEGGYTVTSSLLPELITEGDTLAEALSHVDDALKAVVELYQDMDRPLPLQLCISSPNVPLEFESLLTIS